MIRQESTSKDKILDAAVNLIRAKGYTAATVDDLCAAAGVTKGSFFHHFKSKDDLAIQAAGRFNAMADSLFGSAEYQKRRDPLQRLLGYLDLRIEILQGELFEFTCLLGTMVQEIYATHPPIRLACEEHLSGHVGMLVDDIAAAQKLYAPHAEWSAESLGYHIQSVIQGAFILAKATHDRDVAAECIRHLKRYVELLFAAQRSSKSNLK